MLAKQVAVAIIAASLATPAYATGVKWKPTTTPPDVLPMLKEAHQVMHSAYPRINNHDGLKPCVADTIARLDAMIAKLEARNG